MGLIDILNGMANGPRGAPEPNEPGSGGMSKITMALLGFLAYKAYKNWTEQQASSQGRAPARYPDDERGSRYTPEQGGGIADILRSILSGAQPPGEVVRRGVGNTVDDFNRSGDGDIARSWVDRGPNRAISPERLERAIGDETIRELMLQTGMERQELLETLSEHLPRLIDRLTPEGRVPTDDEAARMR
jgi:uncharacterized protein YidB (DUF937 family)